jgi:DinB family protein
MQRPASSEHAPAFQKYIDRVSEDDILAVLDRQIGETRALIDSIPESEGGHRYAPGKWSIREVIGHLSDAERVFAYRALRFARADATPLSGFDENTYIAPGGFDRRTLGDLMEEYAAVRRGTVTLFRGLDADAWARRGAANQSECSVRALAWIIAGHERHHVSILRERYLATSSR